MKKFIPYGIITALVTPFKNNKVNLLLFEKILNTQLNAGVNAILLFGTTGEPLSLSYTEKRILFYTAKEIAKNKIPIISGLCEVCTDKAVSQAKLFKKWGADAILQTTPYYYRCNHSGIYKHFFKVANTCNLPVIVYNVPARTGFDVTANESLFQAICSIENIVAIKQAENDKQKLKSLIETSTVPILCGCDELNFFAFKSGAIGSISVASNAYPIAVKNTFDLLKNGNEKLAEKLNVIISKFYKLCSVEPNPIPIKFVLSKLYNESMELRLPLDIISFKNADKISEFINIYKELK